MENLEFNLAERFINETSTSVFLTGKAGTGKTTFLKHITSNCAKKFIVVAPTGVAAINAGGVTIHSTFGLPTKMFVPANDYVDPNQANNIQMLSKHFHYHPEKTRLFHELELLIIDEVSMVRADLLDAVDWSLRYTRKIDEPFGGVQLLLIGDLFQLPPVVKDDETNLLSRYYESAFFFHAKSVNKIKLINIELKKIYRQSDGVFIQILNNIRHQNYTEQDVATLEKCYKPDFNPLEPGYITLTTHNNKAEKINQSALENLEGMPLILNAEITGDFYESSYPTENYLKIKRGAQIMFVKNDTSGERKYFNGKIGKVLDLNKEGNLVVKFPNEPDTIEVGKESWENARYKVDRADNSIKKDIIGTFKQYPIRLAWAITIHKSQGLTFEKALIDAGDAFAAGQVYVALSRCTNLQGMVLHSRITPQSIITDAKVTAYSNLVPDEEFLKRNLELAQKQYEFEKLLRSFNFKKLLYFNEVWQDSCIELKSSEMFFVSDKYKSNRKLITESIETSDKFKNQLQQIYNQNNKELLLERANKAIAFFTEKFYTNMIVELESHIEENKKKEKKKTYLRICNDFLNRIWYNIQQMYYAKLDGELIFTGDKIVRNKSTDSVEIRKKVVKGESTNASITMFNEKKTMEEIATARGLAISTIETHIAGAILKKQVNILDLFTENQLEEITKVIKSFPEKTSSTDIKIALNDVYSYNQIRFVTNYLRSLSPEMVENAES